MNAAEKNSLGGVIFLSNPLTGRGNKYIMAITIFYLEWRVFITEVHSYEQSF